MSPTQATSIITTALSTYGTEIKVILTAVLVLGVAYLVFKFGWKYIDKYLSTEIANEKSYFRKMKKKGYVYHAGYMGFGNVRRGEGWYKKKK